MRTEAFTLTSRTLTVYTVLSGRQLCCDHCVVALFVWLLDRCCLPDYVSWLLVVNMQWVWRYRSSSLVLPHPYQQWKR